MNAQIIQSFGRLYENKKPFSSKPDEDKHVSALKKQLDDSNKSIGLQRIESKLKTGARLTGSEKNYLRENSPYMYEKAVRIEIERDEYRWRLERCKTKEEAKSLNTVKMQTLLCEAMSISSNPSISGANKEELLTFISMRAAAITKEYSEYSNS